ncbi:MAG TPA: hypothetical protein VIU62_10940 [Chloroflexota bacterium]|jgi:hypothetical protein
MESITRARESVYPPALRPKVGRLIITIMATGETAIQALGLTEREGDASHQLAERLRPELDALDQAARRLAEEQR